MEPVTILSRKHFELTLERLCYQVIEAHDDLSGSVILGIQPRGIYLAERMQDLLSKILGKEDIPFGTLDITFFRDDIRQKEEPLIPSATDIDLSIENKKVILVDDVLFTGRTIRAALDAMLAYGRPDHVELLVLVDRRFRRQLPIEPNYTGITVDTIEEERVQVDWKEAGEEDQVLLFTPEPPL